MRSRPSGRYGRFLVEGFENEARSDVRHRREEEEESGAPQNPAHPDAGHEHSLPDDWGCKAMGIGDAVAGTGWGEQVRQARVASDVDVDTAAKQVALGGDTFRRYLDDVEAASEAPEDPLGRSRARLVLLGFGLDIAAYGLSGRRQYAPRPLGGGSQGP